MWAGCAGQGRMVICFQGLREQTAYPSISLPSYLNISLPPTYLPTYLPTSLPPTYLSPSYLPLSLLPTSLPPTYLPLCNTTNKTQSNCCVSLFLRYIHILKYIDQADNNSTHVNIDIILITVLHRNFTCFICFVYNSHQAAD